MTARKNDKIEVKSEPRPVVVEDKAAERAAEPATTDDKPEKAEDANTVLVQAVRSFEGVEGDKGPRSEPFRVTRQRYADLKANDLVELVDGKAGSDS